MRNEGIGVIRLDDKTDHGGKVITATSGTLILGQPAALHSDMTNCPLCKGNFAIIAGGYGAIHQGRVYAYDGDITECGARLISSID